MQIKTTVLLALTAISCSAIQSSANPVLDLSRCEGAQCQQGFELSAQTPPPQDSKHDSDPPEAHHDATPDKDVHDDSKKSPTDDKSGESHKAEAQPPKSTQHHTEPEKPSTPPAKVTEAHKPAEKPEKETEPTHKPSESLKPTEPHKPTDSPSKHTEVHHTPKPSETHEVTHESKTSTEDHKPTEAHPKESHKPVEPTKSLASAVKPSGVSKAESSANNVHTPTHDVAHSLPTNGAISSSKGDSSISESAGSSPSPLTVPMARSGPSTEKSHSNHTGAIVGGVVGGSAGLAVIAGLIWYQYSRKRKQFTTVDFGADSTAMSTAPTPGYRGGSRMNAMAITPTAQRNDPSFDIERAANAEAVTPVLHRYSESFYRSPSPTESQVDSIQRSAATSRVSSHPSFGSTDAIVSPTNALEHQYIRYSLEHSRSRPDTPPLGQERQALPQPTELTQGVGRALSSQEMPTSMPPPAPKPAPGEFTASPICPQRNPELDRLATSQIPARQDTKLMNNTNLDRNNTIRSTVTSSSTGTGIREDDLEETLIVGLNGNDVNRPQPNLNPALYLRKEINPNSEQPLFIMTAIEPYMPERPNELLVQPDDELIITEEVSDQWFIGYNRTRNPNVKGYFPRHCVVGSYY
ncbi:hypothetical protein K493DRAFT_318479 [Basidiobolus meristosporus CBS 931.73]|uniref:SH3 domain-containing protein n=1 Tax=Basidiobolus meristosporus CBS 931.73 TaxID=1314790 RepID=A0A1Y1XVQ6_9FUNG|nr:hypothetical protein K493DRAFT_318479 [Basidiobolus meristosporus CBS 931.73]|eukprot:ORX89755.1 hypothetical protein K493DRAFT_318479 [Basidiobolus meristosporus CBS 931.73]